MAFCKYCGKEIPEGGQCTCAESQAAATQTVQTTQTTQTTQATQTAQAAQTTQAAQQSQVVNDGVNDCIGLFVNPIDTLESIFARSSQASGFIFWGIELLVVYLASSLLIFNYAYADRNMFVSGILFTALIALLQFGKAAISFATKDVEGTFEQAIGTFFVTTIPNTALALVMIIPYVLEMPGCGTLLHYGWVAFSSIYGYIAFNTMHKNNKSKSVIIYVLICFVEIALYAVANYYI